MAQQQPPSPLTRRELLTAAAAGAAALSAGLPREAQAAAAVDEKDFSFLLLGDLHYDRLEHHSMDWLQKDKPGDIRQIENYSRITREVLPGLFAELKEQVKADKNIRFVAHIGDLVEGLAGTPELARKHCEDAVAFVRGADLGSPFLFCKGNHDVTGPGAVEAFDSILLPFLAREAKQEMPRSSCFSERRGDCLFAYFDAYHSPEASLAWLEQTLGARASDIRQVFVIIHPPVVPYGARSNWHLFAQAKQAPQRERLLNLLGKHRAIVLCGHLHKYGTVVRETPEGRFLQVATVSVIPSADVRPKDQTEGISSYGPELVRLEPNFSPTTETERRALLAAEAPHIRHWEYADATGYGVVQVQKGKVTLDLYTGLGKRKWRTVALSDLLAG